MTLARTYLCVTLLVTGCISIPEAKTTSDSATETSPIKNVILMIGDGMGPQQISLAYYYAKYAKNSPYQNEQLMLHQLMNRCNVGLLSTNAYQSIVADSASSATQMALGVESRSEMIGLDADGNPQKSVLELAKEKGMSTGLVSDTRLTHATPASFNAHVMHRSQENDIALQMVEGSADIMLSGGYRHFLPRTVSQPGTRTHRYWKSRLPLGYKLTSKRTDDLDLARHAESRGYELALTKSELDACTGDKVLGLFAPSGMPDGIAMKQARLDPDRETPTLQEMTMHAVNRLAKNPNGFFLMIEGGQIDWAAHANDAGTMLHQMLDFDESVKAVYEWAKDRQDTVVIVTADHETGAFGLSYSKYDIPSGTDLAEQTHRPNFNVGRYETLDRLYQQKKSFHQIFKDFDRLPKKQQKPEVLADMVNESLAFHISVQDARMILRTKTNEYYDRNHQYLSTAEVPAIGDFDAFYVYGKDDRSALLARAISRQQQIVWATGTHTATPVPVIVIGPKHAQQAFEGLHRNYWVGQKIKDFLHL